MSPPNFYVLFIYLFNRSPRMVRHRSKNNAKQILRSQNRTRARKAILSSRLLSFTFSRFLLFLFAVCGSLPRRSVCGSCLVMPRRSVCGSLPRRTFMSTSIFHIFNYSLLCVKPFSYLVKSRHD
jgi:hypothetical protein